MIYIQHEKYQVLSMSFIHYTFSPVQALTLVFSSPEVSTVSTELRPRLSCGISLSLQRKKLIILNRRLDILHISRGVS